MKKEVSMPNFVQMEENVLKLWQDNQCFEKLVEKNKNNARYRFLDGPITANNNMGIHHAFGRTLKDLYIKYQSMQGKSCYYQNGFDAHGTPVEIAVEKQLGLNSKKDIAKYGLDNFVENCMQRVRDCSKLIEKSSVRLGQWMDWNNSYYTNTDTNITSIWKFLQVCHENGWLVKAQKPIQWCPRCGTSVSEHEMTGSYKDVEHIAVFFKCPIKNEDKCILVWTTTPWTLSSNVAVAVNPENIYLEVEVKSDSRHLIVGKEAVKVLKDDVVRVVAEFKGEELLGKEYETCFNELPIQNFTHKIIPWEDVEATEGTGAVHIAPGCGVEDYELGKKHGLKEICPIDEAGVVLPEFGVLAGKTTAEVRDVVFDELKKRNKLYYTHTIKHSYPVCWRCKEEIVVRFIDAWYIKVDEIRPKLLKAIEDVKFEPEYLRKRMVDWLNNMGDWNISRSRFYGVPLPFYVCDCGHVHVVGSKEELAKLSSQEEVDNIPHLHRPYIDKVQITCPKCGKKVSRITEVGDCWLDAGITPFSTNKYFTDKTFWENNFPSSVVIEMREQIRLWFYSLLFMSVTLTGKAPYEKIVGHEAVVQESGARFSKSGYMIEFGEYANKLGADTARYLFAGTPLTSDVRFGYNLGEEARRKMLGFWNAYTFFNTYACIDNPDLANFKVDFNNLNNSDKWLLQTVNNFVKVSTDNYENHRCFNIIKDFEALVDDLSNFYIRINRKRFWKSDDKQDQMTAYWCLYTALKNIAGVMAPIIPFMMEHIWQNMVREIEPSAAESIFLSAFPTEIKGANFGDIIDNASICREIITVAQRLRNENQIKVKQPLKTLYLVADQKTENAARMFEQVIKEELNIKEVVFEKDNSKFNVAYLGINFRTAGAVLKQNVQKLKTLLQQATEEQMADYVNQYNNGTVTVGEFSDLNQDVFTLNYKAKSDFVIATENNQTIVLDITIDENLMLEGLFRELVRSAQVLRKEADFNIEQRICISLNTQGETLTKVISIYKDRLMQDCLATQYQDNLDNADITKTITVGDEQVTISMRGL